MTARRLQAVVAGIGLAVIGLVVAGAPARAQDGITLKAGLSYGTASNTGLAPGATQRSGFAVGVAGTTGGMVGFGVEAMYAQRGFTSSLGSSTRRLDYIDVPVYLRLSVPNAAVTPFAYVGPQASYELNCGTDGGNCPASGRPKLTYAGVIGGGVALGALNGLSVEARYVYGLNDLNMGTISSTDNYKTRSLLVLLGMRF